MYEFIIQVEYCDIVKPGQRAYMEKVHVAAGGPFCGVRRRPKFVGELHSFVRCRPNFGRFYSVLSVAVPVLGVFTQFCPSPSQFGAFLLSFVRRRPNFGRFYSVLPVAVPILGVFTQFCPSPSQFWAFLLSFARRAASKIGFLSVIGSRITGLFPCMAAGWMR